MVIENIMYFALGLLVASLLALILLPAVWKRAVRLTKRRIEAATPITMAEFRADKDQLRAEFALSTRRLEMSVETLRARLAEQLGEGNQARSELGLLQAERAQNQTIIAELEARAAQLQARTTELERDSTDLAQRLRMRERELETRGGEMAELRDALRGGLPASTGAEPEALSGEYEDDIARLTTALAIERRRADFLEDQAKSLITRLETSDRRSAEATAAIAQMRDALASRSAEKAADAEALVLAEASIASAESRLNALLAETAPAPERTGNGRARLLADELSQDDAVEKLRRQVLDVENTILSDWDSENFDEAALREKLNDIAGDVSRLFYAAETEPPASPPVEESLFDRVQRFADELDEPAEPVPPPSRRRGSVADRMTALREIQGQ
jgi:chromosome segregation ATPase